jgi:hypothetical protein
VILSARRLAARGFHRLVDERRAFCGAHAGKGLRQVARKLLKLLVQLAQPLEQPDVDQRSDRLTASGDHDAALSAVHVVQQGAEFLPDSGRGDSSNRSIHCAAAGPQVRPALSHLDQARSSARFRMSTHSA